MDRSRHIPHNGPFYFKMSRGIACGYKGGLLFRVAIISHTEDMDMQIPGEKIQLQTMQNTLHNIENTDGTLYECLAFYEYSTYRPNESAHMMGWGGLMRIAWTARAPACDSGGS